MTGKIFVLMGSGSDKETAQKVCETAAKFGVECQMRVASAHRTPKKALDVVAECEKEAAKRPVALVAVVGLSNALSGMVAANTHLPLVTCPNGEDDVPSSLRMPPGVAHGTTLKPENAALFAVKILSVGDKTLAAKIDGFLAEARKKVEDADEQLKG